MCRFRVFNGSSVPPGGPLGIPSGQPRSVFRLGVAWPCLVFQLGALIVFVAGSGLDMVASGCAGRGPTSGASP